MLNLHGTRSALCSENTPLSTKDEIYIRSILTSKLDPSVHANVITFENEKDARLIWKAIIRHFASSESSNRARVIDVLQDLTFNINDIPSFITSSKIAIRRLHKVGIILPRDILAYMLLHKLPNSLKVVKQQIAHSGIEITPKIVLDHLQIFANDLRNKDKNKVQLTALQTQNKRPPLPKCTSGKHNPNSYHSPKNCWALHPELRDAYLKRENEDGGVNAPSNTKK